MGSKRKNIMLLPYFGPTLVKKKRNKQSQREDAPETRQDLVINTILYCMFFQ